MIVRRFATRQAMAQAAASHAAAAIRRAIVSHGRARIIVATGASQLEFLEDLTTNQALDWPRVTLFHLDEYVGLSIEHPASFRRYILDRVIRKTSLQDYLLLDGEGDVREVCRQAGAAVNSAPVDVAFVGIGENVQLDDACRRQQVGEGWFGSICEVPHSAISMSVRQILKSREIICVVPDERKAVPVKAALEGPVTPDVPASALREHGNVTMYLDSASAALLPPSLKSR
jgi:glucosamine-6-phosphate deaminase